MDRKEIGLFDKIEDPTYCLKLVVASSPLLMGVGTD